MQCFEELLEGRVFVEQEDVNLDVSVDKGLQKLIDTAGAGMSVTSPGWLTQLGRLWGGKSVSRDLIIAPLDRTLLPEQLSAQVYI